MSAADRFLPFWQAFDGLFERVEPRWWGAVVTDRRFPAIWDVNYARIDAAEPVREDEIEASLRPALRRSGAARLHVVLHRPEEQTDLMAALSSRGDRLAWDVVMERTGPAPGPADVPVEEVGRPDDAFWDAFRASLAEFRVTDREAVRQIEAMERQVLLPVKRWFVVRSQGAIASLAALVTLAGVGYVDHVVTFPPARRRGYAGAIVTRITEEAGAAGCDRVFLLADDGSPAIRLYERLGFRTAGRIGSTLRLAHDA